MHAPDLPSAVESVLLRALSKRAQDRYASVREFARALETAALGSCSDFTPMPLERAKTTYVLAGTLEAVALRPRAPADASSRTSSGIGKSPLMAVRQSRQSVRDDSGWLLGRTWTWVAAGSAVLLAGGATVAGLTMQSKFNALDARCGRSSGQTYTGCKSSDFATLDSWKTTANVLWGLSAAAAVTAGVLFYVEGRGVEVSPTAGQVIGFNASMRY